ncbi:MAG: Aldehyde Dehydrogenase [Firmicutes bacterium]|nr:Aldehyde Dehydrogenase [Bacillota bacterium]
MTQEYRLFINGEWIATERKQGVFNKATGDLIGECYVAGQKEITMAVDAAQNTFRVQKLDPYRRFEILKRASELLLERQEDFALTISQEVGKTLKEARGEVIHAVQTLLVSAEEAKTFQGELVPVNGSRGNANRFAYTLRIPVGVVCAITPFNVPLNLSCHKIGPALAAGNTVVYKPASVTPITGAKLCQVFIDAGLPNGFLNLLMGAGSVVGSALVKDERIAFYSFTGSVDVGKELKNAIGFRRLSLELGSNAPNIIHHDADLAFAVEACIRAAFANAGQLCMSSQRIYVHESIYQQFCSQAVAATQSLKVGDPLDPSTDIGPMISVSAAIRAENWIREAETEGATVLIGGWRKGPFLQPTILTDVTADMKVVSMEAFAPIFTVAPYKTIEEAIALANNSFYGLQAGVFTNSMDIANRCIAGLEVGGVLINDASTFRADCMPYGGVKDSGFGKEGPRYTMKEMTEEKIVVMKI